MDMSEVRRSSRPHKASKVASYDEEVDAELSPLRKRVKTTSSKRYNDRKPHQVKVATAEQRANTMKLAEKLKSSLPSEHPSFIRSMIKSHVYTCYWLSIPTPFCNDHLPSKDQKIILEDEKGEEHDTNFLARRTGLSGGWRGFALNHKLHDGDAVIFELTQPARFKVYIIRAHDDLEEEQDVLVTESVEEQNTEKDVDVKLLESEKPVELAVRVVDGSRKRNRQKLTKPNTEKDVDVKLLESEKPVELAVPIKEKAAPKPRVDGSRKRNRRKLTKPVKSDDGVSGSKIDEEDDLIDDAILNGAVATENKPGVPMKIKLFRRRRVSKVTLYSMRRIWVDDDSIRII